MIRAIVVDDEPIARMDFVEMLKEYDINVIGVGKDGFDAVDLCNQYSPDLVLMDIKMPVFDGLSSSKAILKDNPAICIVLITAYSDSDFIEQAKEIGVAGYLVKPIEERTLIPTLELAISQRKRYMEAVKGIESMKKTIEDKNIIDRAKFIVAKKEGISEGEAYNLIRKMSMDKRCSIAEMANSIIKLDSTKDTIEWAKRLLKAEYGCTDSQAYERVKNHSKKYNCSISEAAIKIINYMKD